VLAPSSGWAQDRDTTATQDTTRARPNLAGPDQVDNQLESDAQPKEPFFELTFLDPYFEFKDRLKERTGLGFGIDYSTVYMKASASLAEDQAWSGMLRLFGSWELVGRGSDNSGAFVFKVEHRHRYLTIAPKQLSFNIGYAGIFAAPFSDEKLRWTNLYWRQRLGGGRFVFLAGFLDATDFFDVYGMASPWLHFTNLTFSTGSAATALPNDALLGVAAGAWLSDQIYALASVGDNGSDPTDPFSGFDRFVNVNEYFSSLELGWTTSKGRAYLDNVHVSVWHSDAKTSTSGDPSGWGVNFSATKYIDDTWLPFVRGGYTEDGGSLLQKSLSLGVGYQPVQYGGLVGFGFNWGEPNATTWGSPDLPDQYSFELFYRWQVGDRLAVTPDLQYFINPALNPDQSSIWLFGVRARLAL
jgi:porin